MRSVVQLHCNSPRQKMFGGLSCTETLWCSEICIWLKVTTGFCRDQQHTILQTATIRSAYSPNYIINLSSFAVFTWPSPVRTDTHHWWGRILRSWVWLWVHWFERHRGGEVWLETLRSQGEHDFGGLIWLKWKYWTSFMLHFKESFF